MLGLVLVLLATACSNGSSGPSSGASAAPACQLRQALHEHQLGASGARATPDQIVIGRLETASGPVARDDSGSAGVDLLPYHIADASDFEIALGEGAIAGVRLLDRDGNAVAEVRARSAAAPDVVRTRVTAGDYVLEIRSDGSREQHYLATPRACVDPSTATPLDVTPSDETQRKTPGVYVGELNGFPASVVGVSTVTTAFVGYVGAGAVGTPTPIVGLDDFTSIFGAAALASPVGVAVSQFYANGGGSAVIVGTASSAVSDVIGDAGAKTGIYALTVPGEISLLVLPDLPAMSAADALTLLATVVPYAATYDAFTIIDGPAALSSPADFGAWVSGSLVPALSAQQPPETVLPFAAAYAPQIVVAAAGGGSATVPAGGAIAAAFGVNDEQNGVWSAPAGPDKGVLTAATGAAVTLDDQDVADLTADHVNAIRTLSGDGTLLWGAVTLQSDPTVVFVQDARTELYLRASISSSLAWVVFEPDDETLWSSVTAQVSSFLTSLWQQGGLHGSTADEAFQVTVGLANNPPDDVLNGILHVDVSVRLSSDSQIELVFTFLTAAAGA